MRGKGVVFTQVIRIGTRHYAPYLAARLAAGIDGLNLRGVASIYISQHEKGGMTFFPVDVSGQLWLSPGRIEDIYCFVAGVIADLIVHDVHRVMLEDMLKDGYPGLDEDERFHICQRAIRALWVRLAGGLDGALVPSEDLERVKEGVRAQVYGRALEYLRANSELNVEGFVRFRLRDQVSLMFEMVGQVVEDYLAEREYREFIRLLRYFVDIQEPRIQVVHVFEAPDGSYRLVDQDNREVRSEYLDEILGELSDGVTAGEDLLVSMLITIAPARIILHLRPGSEAVETVKNVFEEKAEVCTGCPRCKADSFKSFP
ncbi:MAG TPA: hypothetical protein GX506_07450 [Firmicutes bacterium]|nr:hypothetical protein [Bacillota bacterium]